MATALATLNTAATAPSQARFPALLGHSGLTSVTLPVLALSQAPQGASANAEHALISFWAANVALG